MLNSWISDSSLRQENNLLHCRHRLDLVREKLFDFNFALSVGENPLSLEVQLHVQSCLNPDKSSKAPYTVSPMRLPANDLSDRGKLSLIPIRAATVGALRRQFLEARWLIQKLFQAQSQLTPHAITGTDSVSREFLQNAEPSFKNNEPFVSAGNRLDLRDSVEVQPLPIDASGKPNFFPRLRGLTAGSCDDLANLRRERVEKFPIQDPRSGVYKMPVICLSRSASELSSLVVEKQDTYLGRDILGLAKTDLVTDAVRQKSMFDPKQNWMNLDLAKPQKLKLLESDVRRDQGQGWPSDIRMGIRQSSRPTPIRFMPLVLPSLPDDQHSDVSSRRSSEPANELAVDRESEGEPEKSPGSSSWDSESNVGLQHTLSSLSGVSLLSGNSELNLF